MVINNAYEIGDEVYLKTDFDQLLRIVTGIIVRPSCVVYELSQGSANSEHYDFEISREINELIKVK